MIQNKLHAVDIIEHNDFLLLPSKFFQIWRWSALHRLNIQVANQTIGREIWPGSISRCASLLLEAGTCTAAGPTHIVQTKAARQQRSLPEKAESNLFRRAFLPHLISACTSYSQTKRTTCDKAYTAKAQKVSLSPKGHLRGYIGRALFFPLVVNRQVFGNFNSDTHHQISQLFASFALALHSVSFRFSHGRASRQLETCPV